jgi:GNAT superfamily N-acetyltransferase
MSMSSIEVRPFNRADREQLTALVNAHVAAVVPGASVSVNGVLSQLEREPGEFIVDPWVGERVTLVAIQRGRLVAAAHLVRYASGDEVGESYRDAGGIKWFVYWPKAPYWPDSVDAGETLLSACVRHLDRWGVSRQYADGALPAPGVYGVPDQWPHVRASYEQAGFVHQGRIEIVYVAEVELLPRMSTVASSNGLTLRRALGINGTRLSAVRGDDVLGYVEVEALGDAGSLPRHGGWADIGNLDVVAEHRRHGIGTWLIAQAADWLHLARIDRVLAYAWPEQEDSTAFLGAVGFRELTRTSRGWVRTPPVPS